MRRLDGLGAGVAEEQSLDLLRAARDQLLGQQSRQQRAVHLHHAGQVGVEGLVQRVLDHRVRATQGEDAEAAQHVEVAIAVVVEEVAALAALVETVETERRDDLGELRVEVLGVQGEVVAVSLFHQLLRD